MQENVTFKPLQAYTTPAAGTNTVPTATYTEQEEEGKRDKRLGEETTTSGQRNSGEERD